MQGGDTTPDLRPSDIWVDDPRAFPNAGDMYDLGKGNFENIFELYLQFLSPELRKQAKDLLHNQEFSTSRNAALMMQQISAQLWQAGFFSRLMGLVDYERETPLQKEFQHKLCTHNPGGTLNRIKSEHLVGLFPPGEEKKWPKLVLTANHARTWQHKDL